MIKPVIEYRKFLNGCEFMKVINSSEAITVLRTKLKSYRIAYSSNPQVIDDYFGENSRPSTEQEFASAYNEAMQQINLIKEM